MYPGPGGILSLHTDTHWGTLHTRRGNILSHTLIAVPGAMGNTSPSYTHTLGHSPHNKGKYILSHTLIAVPGARGNTSPSYTHTLGHYPHKRRNIIWGKLFFLKRKYVTN